MAKNKEEKTNVMRTLDQRKVPYTPHTYDPNGPVDGVSVAAGLGMDPGERVQNARWPRARAGHTMSSTSPWRRALT